MKTFFTWASVKTGSTKGDDLLNNFVFGVMFIQGLYILFT